MLRLTQAPNLAIATLWADALAAEGIAIVPPPAPPVEPDPIKTAETVLALADLVDRDKAAAAPMARRKPAGPATPVEAKGADR